MLDRKLSRKKIKVIHKLIEVCEQLLTQNTSKTDCNVKMEVDLHEVPDEILSDKLDNFPLVSSTRRLAFVADTCLGLFLNVTKPLLLRQVPKEGLIHL